MGATKPPGFLYYATTEELVAEAAPQADSDEIYPPLDTSPPAVYSGYDGLAASIALVRSDRYPEQASTPPTLTTPDDVYSMCQHLTMLEHDTMAVLVYQRSDRSTDSDLKHVMCAIHERRMTGRESQVEKLRFLAGIISVHNATHLMVVMGRPRARPDVPSKKDVQFVRASGQLCRALGAELLDYVVVTRHGFVSTPNAGSLVA